MSKFPEYLDWIPIAIKASQENSGILIFEHWRNTAKLWIAMEKAGLKIQSMIIWHKTNHHELFTPGGFWNIYDIILAGTQGGKLPIRKKRAASTFDIIESPVSSKHESGQDIIRGCKPVQILTPYINAITDSGQIVFEPFGGAGSCIIACEKLQRKCRAIEINPSHCDVTIERWQNFTGEKAKRKK